MSDEEKQAEREAMLARFIARERALSPDMTEEELRFFAEVELIEFVRDVNEQLQLYAMEKNGLCIWRALNIIIKAGEPVHPKIMEKFVEWGSRLEKAQNPVEIARAIDMAGDKDTYKGKKGLHAAIRRRNIAEQVFIVRKTYPDLSLEKSFEIVAKNGYRLSKSQVKKAYHEFYRPSRKTLKETASTDLQSVLARSWR